MTSEPIYAEELAWTEPRREELICGKVVMMAPPATNHGVIAGNVHALFHSYLRGKSCTVFPDDVPLFLISLKAGGTGINLTAADMVIHYDPWWNVAAQEQATDRAHRIGQEKQVTVFKLITKDTIEENILKLQAAKQALADQVVAEGMVSLGSLSRQEILELVDR